LPQPQLTDEAILQRGPQPLDAAFGLRRVGADIADPQAREHPPQVRGGLLPRQLFLQTPVLIGAHEDVAAIAIERHGDAIGGDHLVPERGVAVEIFGRPEMQRDDLRRRIVDRAQQRERRAPALEPRKGAAVELEQSGARRRRLPGW
jgi:hypothetical protein